MKKIFLPVAIVAAMSMLNTSCQKETIVDPSSQVAQTSAVYTVQYTINGVRYQATLDDESEYDALMRYLVALARNGYSVTIWNPDKYQTSSQSKDVVVYTTTSEDDAIKWGKKMMDNGYSVTISYDSGTGVYTCIARN